MPQIIPSIDARRHQRTHLLSSAETVIRTHLYKVGAKLLQKIGTHKSLPIKIKFIYIFIAKGVSFAQRCECNFGGNPLGGPKLLQFLHICKFIVKKTKYACKKTLLASILLDKIDQKGRYIDFLAQHLPGSAVHLFRQLFRVLR